MASSEGVTFRWEVFNRWCDEYSQLNNGNKPKVEDVRRWHRENAEKVWPDSSERPSVFLAVSHNKGRRVRGHKTCEYYKRYRAGKAAEQQLAARLQPAALSGRRILAVTAAARKVNTDCARAAVKRASPDDGTGPSGSDVLDIEPGLHPDLGHADKRCRMRTFERPFEAHGESADEPRRGAGAQRLSSDGPSEDASWASGAETSNEDEDMMVNDSGTHAAAPPMGPARRFGAAALYPPARGRAPGGQVGVHITVVRRDADGRTIQVETQPAWGGLQEHAARAAAVVFPYLPSGKAAPVAAAVGLTASSPGGSGGGSDSRELLQPREGSVVHPAGSGYRPQLGGGRTVGRDCGAARDSGGEQAGCEEDDSLSCEGSGAESARQGEERRHRSDSSRGAGTSSQQGQQEKHGCSADAHGWGCPGDLATAPVLCCHPGVAPPACRRVRSRSEGEGPPQLCGRVATPLGSMPVYRVGSRVRTANGNGVTRRKRLACDAPKGVVAAAAAARDPLDLLAEAACGAIASPRPTGYGGEDLEANEPAPDVDDAGLLSPAAGAAAAALDADGAAGAGRRAALPSGSGDPDTKARRDHTARHLVAALQVQMKAGSDDEAHPPGCGSPLERHGRKQGLRGKQQPQQPEHGSLPEAAGLVELVKQEPADGVRQIDTQCRVCETARGAHRSVNGASSSSGESDTVGRTCRTEAATTTTMRPGFGSSGSGCGSGCGLAKQRGTDQQQQRQQKQEGEEERRCPEDVKPPSLRPSPDPLAASVPLVKPAPRLSSPGSGVTDAAAGGAADTGVVAAAMFGRTRTQRSGGAGALPLRAAELEAAEMAGRAVSANLELAGVAAALMQGQQAGLALNHPSAVGTLGLGFGPVATPLPALPFPGLAAMSSLPLPGALHAAAAMAMAAAPPPLRPPMLWPSLAGRMGAVLSGAPALTAAAAAAPLFAEASMFGGALAGAGSGGGQLLPMMRLLHMQMVARGLDQGPCQD